MAVCYYSHQSTKEPIHEIRNKLFSLPYTTPVSCCRQGLPSELQDHESVESI
jgi:hypothetical protein